MTPGFAGQLTVCAIVLFFACRYAHKHGYLRGWRDRDAKGGAVRMEAPLKVVRGSWRAKKTPTGFPVPARGDHEDWPGHG